MSSPSPEIHRGHIYIWGRENSKQTERDYIMNEPSRLIRKKGNFGSTQKEVDPRTLSSVDEFAGFVTEGSDDIEQIQKLMETITQYILSSTEDEYDDHLWNRTVSRVANHIYLRAMWIRANVPLSMVVPYIYRQDVISIGSEDFGFTGKTISLDSLMTEIGRTRHQDLLLRWDLEDPHVVYIMRALTERLNFDRLLYLRKQNEQAYTGSD